MATLNWLDYGDVASFRNWGWGACGEFELTGLWMDIVMKFVPGLINASGSPSKIQFSCNS